MIELKQIRKDYGERTVIKNQSLSIKDKEFFVLIGPSGSGKTTLLKLINRLIDPTEGDVLLNGKSVMDYPLRELRLNTGYVLQQIALFPNLTVAENIELVPVMKKWPKQIRKEQTTQLLSKVGLDPSFSSCRIGETSDSFLLLMIDTLFLYVLVHAKGWGAANHLAVWKKILSEEE